MSHDISDLRGTIVPKSDQLNAEQLLSGDLTITVTDVRVTGSDEQPVVIHYDGDAGRPFKPSKTVRKILIYAWGDDGRNWIGKSMVLFNDQSVRFGGMTVGGIRVSHLSDIKSEIAISLTATKGKKAQHTIQVLQVATSLALNETLTAIAAANNRDTMAKAKALVMKLTRPADIQKAQTAYAERVNALKAQAPTAPVPDKTELLAQTLARIAEHTNVESLGVYLDDLREKAQPEHRDEIAAAGLARMKELED